MHVPLPPLSRRLTIGAASLGLAMLLGLAAIGNADTFAERLVVKLFEAGAPVAFAAAGLSEIGLALRKREWTKRTSYLAFSLLERAEEELAALQKATYGVLVGALPAENRSDVLPAGPAFRIPIGDVQARYFDAAIRLAGDAKTVFDRAYSLADLRHDELLDARLQAGLKGIFDSLDAIESAVRRKVDEEASEPPAAADGPGLEPAADALNSADELAGAKAGSPPAPQGEAPQAPHAQTSADDQERRVMRLRELDASELCRRADAAAAGLRDRWAALEESIGQLSGFLDSDSARTLLESSVDLRHAAWIYESSMPEPEDAAARADAELRAAQELASRARRARDAAAFVLQVLMTGWIVLTELDAIFRHRFADFPAAVDHRKFKEKYDELEAAALQSQEIRGDAEPMLRELESEVRRLFEEHSEKRPERTVD